MSKKIPSTRPTLFLLLAVACFLGTDITSAPIDSKTVMTDPYVTWFDFEDGNHNGWSFKNTSNWEVTDGILEQKNSVSTSGNWLQYYASMDGAGEYDSTLAYLEGDFAIRFRIGFNESAYPMQNSTTIGGSIWQRSMAVGIMKDTRNALLATFYRSHGSQNGIAKITGGSTNFLYTPFTGQGMGQDVHDIREIEIFRKNGVITVKADGEVLYQALEEGSALSGYPVICSRGPAGLALEQIDGSAEYSPDTPTWVGPNEIRNFEFCMSDLDNHTITSLDGNSYGTVEGGTKEEGAFMGWWVQDGAADNRWSWAAAGGVLTIQNWTMAENATLETWFKVPTWPSDVTSVPLFHLMFDGSLLSDEWGRERGGPVLEMSGGELTMYFHEFGWVDNAPSGISITFDEWHHFAWVREGVHDYLYIDFEEVAAFDISRYGTTELTGMQINMANNADHDWVRRIGEPLLLIDRVAGSDEALNPDSFTLLGSQNPATLATPPAVYCDINEDGEVNISDVIALLLIQRNNPEDPAGDYNNDGAANVSDAISLLINIRDGVCYTGGGEVTSQEDCFN